MKLLGATWTPEAADRWTAHDLVAAILSPIAFVTFALGGTWVAIGNPRGWWYVAIAVGASLLLWAVIDGKLKAQSIAFAEREAAHKNAVDERNRWEDNP